MPDFVVEKLISNRAELYCAQGQLDGGCAIHAAASALTVLGVVTNPSRISIRRSGPQSRFWQKMKDVYADGIELAALTERLRELDFGLKLTHLDGTHHQILAFAEAALLRGRPVILSLAPVSQPRRLHAVLSLGLQGKMERRNFVPHAALCVDSAANPPGIGPINGRIEYSPGGKRERSSLYVTAWEQYRITLTGALSLQLTESAQPDRKPP